MWKILFVLAGGALGSVFRYSVSGMSHRLFTGVFPYGTLVVNLAGSFFIGFAWGLLENTNISSNFRTFLFIGIFGGFTTFSSYSLETMNLLRDGEIKMGLINILGSNLLGLLLVFLGFILSKSIIQSLK